ncbi:threonine/serine exporter family protein [Acuticoccus mangrovi]|uniref:Threonine/serine exporter family protein n=1 Tax=Acuticoccus mangrovi TaxID=2796142 RepID=A0A934ME55_9HYPH|nr:threonine/serine exporter family protein [Acuticoccus mangrovi]MBJ3777117.1 threonine/serine exporter family protein [Acuticoccus mangrovi]
MDPSNSLSTIEDSGARSPPADAPSASDVAHLVLRLGRLLVLNGADSAHVEQAMTTLAEAWGYRARPLILPEGLLLTLEGSHGYCTRLGRTIAGPSVNMGTLEALEDIRRDGAARSWSPAAIDARLDAVESGSSGYPAWLVGLAMGVTAAALARLFSATAAVTFVSVFVGASAWTIRARLAAAGMNPIAAAALAAFGGGLVGSLGVQLFPGTSPVLCLVAGGLVLVPSVPLLNGVRDTLGRHVVVGLARLSVGTVTILAIAFGLFLVAAVTGDALVMDATAARLPLWEELPLAAVVGIGVALVFNVPAKAAWICMVCAIVGRGTRTLCQDFGLDLVAASLVAALAAALVARCFAIRYRVPTVTFAFPGVVGMMPASSAFRAGSNGLAIIHAGADAPPPLVGETLALAGTAALVTAAIAIGLSIAFALPFDALARRLGRRGQRDGRSSEAGARAGSTSNAA